MKQKSSHIVFIFIYNNFYILFCVQQKLQNATIVPFNTDLLHTVEYQSISFIKILQTFFFWIFRKLLIKMNIKFKKLLF